LNTMCSGLNAFRKSVREEGVHQAPVIMAKALQSGAWAVDLIARWMADARDRVMQLDTAISTENMMLDFCVDTHDPRAHKHQEVIDTLTEARQSLTEGIERYVLCQKQTLDQCAALYQKLCQKEHVAILSLKEKAAIAELRARHTAFSEALATLDTPKLLPRLDSLIKVARTPVPEPQFVKIGPKHLPRIGSATRTVFAPAAAADSERRPNDDDFVDAGTLRTATSDLLRLNKRRRSKIIDPVVFRSKTPTLFDHRPFQLAKPTS
jgi:hypothetical protein